MVGQAGMVDVGHLGVLGQELDDLLGVLDMALDAQRQRLGALQEQEGVGIGLYLARQIISGEGGYIRVTSAPGEGSTFSVFLPK